MNLTLKSVKLLPGSVTGNFAATLRFNVRDVDPTTGEAESDDTYEDSYVVSVPSTNMFLYSPMVMFSV